MSMPSDQARAAFRARFAGEPAVWASAPGRVNLIGEHTDYNAGFVLPMPLAQRTHLAARPITDPVLRVHAAQLGEDAEIDLRPPVPVAARPWANYLAGVAHFLAERGCRLAGAEAVLWGDVPLGCGLSSSAALEMAAVRLFETLGAFQLDDETAARVGQQAEHAFLGVHCGIMDQFASRAGRPGHALFLDCRSLAAEQVPVNLPEHCFVVANTGAHRDLAASQYNARVAECARAMAALAPAAAPPATHLRDIGLDALEDARSRLDGTAYRRARHVITENARTVDACAALRHGDAPRLGALMNASDASLREDYAVTGPDLDAMTACARAAPGCVGSRMTGAGFGGCAIHLVERGALRAFSDHLCGAYAAATGRTPSLWVVDGVAGI
jgi:galactokinase